MQRCRFNPFRLDCLIRGALICAFLFVLPPVAHAESGVRLAHSDSSRSPVTQLAAVSYTAFDGHTETLVPWQGTNVSVLVEPGPARDEAVMAKLVGALDRAWSYYRDTTGRIPADAHSLNGRDMIAEVSSTCGAGCGYLGFTGIEVATPYFETMYTNIATSDLYDQIPFYELGRNFWFWTSQLAFQPPEQDPVVTGFAVWMRFESMSAAGVEGAPFNGRSFSTFQAEVADLASEYESDPSLTFADTLAQAKSPGLYGGTDFWASLMMQLAARHGGQQFIERFWQAVDELPAATSTAGSVANWEAAASSAACAELADVFYLRWGFPRPDGTVSARESADAVAEPAGRCGSTSTTIMLLPTSATRTVGAAHTLTTTMTSGGEPVSGAPVVFTIAGANRATFARATDADGAAVLSYTGQAPGDDLITACLDENQDGGCAASEPTATATATWRQPVVITDCFRPPCGRVPQFRLSGPKRQRFRGSVKLRARCDIDCVVSGGARVVVSKARRRYHSKHLTRRLVGRHRESITLRFSRRARHAIRLRLRRGQRLRLLVTLRARSSAAGGSRRSSQTLVMALTL
jgi:hypothetical protein